MSMARAIVIGAGIGGLTTAAVLARAGLDVTVLEGLRLAQMALHELVLPHTTIVFPHRSKGGSV